MKSTTAGSSLCFSNKSPEYFDVTVETPNLTATKQVFIYTYAPTNDFVEFFQRIAGHARPWSGEEIWESLEGEMRLRATCDPLGHVQFEITLKDYDRDWSVVCAMLFDFGTLSQHAIDAARFMAL